MAKHILEPAGDYVLVVDGSDTVVVDGIELPSNVRQKEMLFGTVVFVGPEAAKTHPEDQICYGPYAGKSVVMNGIEFRILRQGQIEAYLRVTQ